VENDMKTKQTIKVNPDESTHQKLIAWVNEADDATQASRTLSEKCRDYYDSLQWTESEKKKLAAQKQAATVRNRIKPKVDGLLGMEKANKTTAKAFPRTPEHEKAANAATESIRFCLQDNFYEQIRSAAWENMLLEGSGGVEVIVKEVAGAIEINLNHIQWDRLIYDPHSRTQHISGRLYGWITPRL
jgi:Fe-S cluster assembly scaffold protein SufB